MYENHHRLFEEIMKSSPFFLLKYTWHLYGFITKSKACK
jgi:hypothetical protein